MIKYTNNNKHHNYFYNKNDKIDNNFFYVNYVNFIVEYIQNTGDMSTGMTCIE